MWDFIRCVVSGLKEFMIGGQMREEGLSLVLGGVCPGGGQKVK